MSVDLSMQQKVSDHYSNRIPLLWLQSNITSDMLKLN